MKSPISEQCDRKSVGNNLGNSGNDDNSSSVIWRSIIGDICQLSSIPRPTTDPGKYVECVFQAENAGNRSDLGIWMSRDCPIGHQFVASARECKTDRFIEARQQLCDGPNAEEYKFCPQLISSPKFMVKRVEQQKKQCSCPVDYENCECPKVIIIELVTYNESMNEKNISKVRQARQVMCQGYQRCIISGVNCANCSNSGSTCICGPSYPTYLPGDTNFPSKQIAEGCHLLNNGQLHCPEIREETGKQQYPSINAPQACPIAVGRDVEEARYQRLCSWMIEPLVADPESPSHFLQCQPASNSLYCGRWQRMPCEPGLIFDASLQVCVRNPSMQSKKIPIVTHSSGIIATYPPINHLPHASSEYLISPVLVVPRYGSNMPCTCHIGVQIGSCGPNGQCPGQSICEDNQIAEQGSITQIAAKYKSQF
uniref:Chitin-binding type-2 domain-containing protein n=1 Tax=Elaeophora elaphi TaxID=1147741 RepID=A0A0R3S3E2_9BILA